MMPDYYRGNQHYKSLSALAKGAAFHAKSQQYCAATIDVGNLAEVLMAHATEDNRDTFLAIISDAKESNRRVKQLLDVFDDLHEWIDSVADKIEDLEDSPKATC